MKSYRCQIFWSGTNPLGRSINGNGEIIELTESEVNSWNNYVYITNGYRITHKVTIHNNVRRLEF